VGEGRHSSTRPTLTNGDVNCSGYGLHPFLAYKMKIRADASELMNTAITFHAITGRDAISIP